VNSYRKLCSATLSVMTLAVLFCMSATAQGPADLSAENQAAATPAPDPPQQNAGTSDDAWHFDIAPYVWFPGVHGTVGALGREASVHVSGSDLLSDFNGGLAGLVQARKNRWVIPIDLTWTRLATTHAFPLDILDQNAVRVQLSQVIFTPKLGYRIVDTEHLKFDALGGIRYWHLGNTLTFRPSQLSGSRSANWVDGVGGGRFEFDLTPKVAIIAAGDAGGGSANLDYQAVGTLNIQPKPRFGFFVGWRYLDVDYRGNRGFINDVAQSGPLVGLDFQFGGKPPVPPAASCSVAPTEVYPGDPVTATIRTQNFNPKHTVTYKWSSTGSRISGTGTSGNVDTSGLAPGSYTVTGTATDAREKKNNVASCNASFTVKAKPMNPPQVTCSASPSTVQSGSPSTITATATSPDGAQITGDSYTASGGTISGTGTTATLDTTGAPSGAISVTVTATDARNLTGTGTCSVGVEVPPPPPTCSKASAIQFPDAKRPWRVDNTAKAILDDVASRLKSDPNAKIVIVGYADGEKAPMVGTGKNRHPINLAAQRAVNAKAYLVQDQGIDGSRVEVRQGTGQSQVADIIWVPQGANESACAVPQNTTAVDESVVKPSENAYPKPRTATPMRHHHAAGSTQQ
jgi:outer membrane protein OmpA-like peptidoglycan-associated protein